MIHRPRSTLTPDDVAVADLIEHHSYAPTRTSPPLAAFHLSRWVRPQDRALIERLLLPSDRILHVDG